MKINELHNQPVQPDTYEASMALNQLLKIGKHAIKIHNMIDDRAEMEAWVAKKIDLAGDYVKKVHGYMQGEKAGLYDDSGLTEDQTTIEVKAILDKHGIKSTDDIEYGSDAFSDLFDYFSSDPDEMPYGVQKARTGMPDEWIADRLIDLGLLDEDDTSSKGMNKYGLAAVNKDGKFYSYRNGKLTGTFDNMKDLQKHQHDLIKNEDLGQMAHKVEQDHEVQMARSDLYKAAKYSIKLHERLKNISEEEGLEGWVAAKITKASDYLSSVYHYMDYEMMTHESYLPEGWVDDLKKLGGRGLDKMKALYDPATAAKVKADDMATADAGTMMKDIISVHAMNQQDMSQGFDNNTVLAYLKKYIEPRNPQAFLDLSKSNTPLKRLFPVNGKMTKQALQGNLQKVGQILQKVDLTPDAPQQEPQGEPATQNSSIDYKESVSYTHLTLPTKA